MSDVGEKIAAKYGIDLSYEHKTACPGCRKKGGDNSGNNLHVYGPGRGAKCYAECGFKILSDDFVAQHGMDAEQEEEEEEVSTREKITREEYERIRGYTGAAGKDYRGIRDETNHFYGVRYEYDPETGEPCKQFVPTTVEGKMAGYRTRVFPKDFTNPIGQVGKECDMIGEVKFPTHTRICVISGGETKMMNTYQMLKDSQEMRGKGEYETTAVVCSTLGEGAAFKQVQLRYKFFDRFDKIIVCMDNDKAGREGAEKICKALPKGKAFVMTMRYKDADDYVAAGKEKEFISDWWAAKPYVPAGIVGSGDLGVRLREEVSTEKVPFPPFMKELNEKTAGGFTLGKIINLAAGSGTGKTTWVDTMIYYWIFNSPHKIGVVSMELNAGQYGLSMLSRHIGRKISNIQSRKEQQEFLEQDWVKEKEHELFFKENGEHRWHLVDDRDGSVEELKKLIEELVISMGVRVIVIDVLSDVMDGLSNDEQALFMKWQKSMVKSHNVTFFNINHIRKGDGKGGSASNGGMPDEESMIGSSTIYKSASLNLLLRRDKMAEDPLERNLTYAYLSKNRDGGITGPSGEFVYDNDTHQLMHKDDWLAKQPAGTF